MKSTGLSESEIAQVARLLSKLTPGFLPFDVFHEVTRLVATPIIEVVPLRMAPGNKVEVLLVEREANDPVWPGQLHVPGTVVRASDTPGSFDDPLRRILSDELAAVHASEPKFVRNVLHHSGRSLEMAQIFWVEVRGEPRRGVFYDVHHLPKSIIASQRDFIPDAVAHFKNVKRRRD